MIRFGFDANSDLYSDSNSYSIRFGFDSDLIRFDSDSIRIRIRFDSDSIRIRFGFDLNSIRCDLPFSHNTSVTDGRQTTV